ncbi:MAG TPA: EF-hand domain-containing protein [Syntrophorhabdaceae bacterium]|nr:EF-hand domain-containing protein [Syntrophorhabdaceae bacterium]
MISSVSGLSSFNQSSMIQMRQQMFGKIDTNGDGKHDADELARMVASGPQGGPSVEDILSKFDTDSDGAISESEFNAAGAPPPPPMGGAESTSTVDFIKEMFGKIDANSDGAIDADELEQMAAMGPQGGPSADELLTQLDTDGDGSISESEFSQGPFANQHVQGPPPPPPPAEDESEVETIFSALDTNGDGSISESEFNAALEQMQAGSSGNTVFNTLFGETSNNDASGASTTDNGSIDSVISSLQALNSALSAYIQSSGGSHSANNYSSGAFGGGSFLYA